MARHGRWGDPDEEMLLRAYARARLAARDEPHPDAPTRPAEPSTTTPRVGWEARERLGRDGQEQEYLAAVTPAISTMRFDVGAQPDLAHLVARADEESARFASDLALLLPSGSSVADLLFLLEAIPSSRIEGLAASAEDVARRLAAAPSPSAPDTPSRPARRNEDDDVADLVASNARAVDRALDSPGRVDASTQWLLGTHRTLMRGQPHASPGALRLTQVWIGGFGGPLSASFVPPHHERVATAMADLEEFLARVDLTPVLRAAVAHAQFETIHPFVDGNGRAGRILVNALMARPDGRFFVPISLGLLADFRTVYYGALTAYRNGDVEPVVRLFARATIVAAAITRRLASDLVAVSERWEAQIDARPGSAARRLLPLLLTQPVITSSWVQRRLDVSGTTAGRAISILRDAGVIERATHRQRQTVWFASCVTEAIDEAVRSGARR